MRSSSRRTTNFSISSSAGYYSVQLTIRSRRVQRLERHGLGRNPYVRVERKRRLRVRVRDAGQEVHDLPFASL